MREGKVFGWLWLGALAFGLSGCQSTVEITSYPAKDVHIEIRRLMVVSSVMEFESKIVPNGMHTSAFEGAFTDALGNCRVTADFLFRDQLAAIDNSEGAVRKFAPDAILFLDRTFPIPGGVNQARYSTGIIDMTTKKIAWTADVEMIQGANQDQALAAAIANRLKSDSILGTACNNPGASRRAS